MDYKRKSDNIIIFKLPKCPLNAGQYSMSIHCVVNGEVSDWMQNAIVFEISEGKFYNSGKVVPKNQSDLFFDFEII